MRLDMHDNFSYNISHPCFKCFVAEKKRFFSGNTDKNYLIKMQKRKINNR